LMMTPPPRPKSSSTPNVSCFDQVKLEPNSKPWLNRLVAFNCSDSYQVSPSGTQCQFVMLPYCGKGRSDCATVADSGNPAYGAVNPRAAANAELIGEASNVRSAALLRSSPYAARVCCSIQLVQMSPAA